MMRAASEAKIASSLSGSNKEFRGFDRTNTATVMETSRSGTESPIQQTSGKIEFKKKRFLNEWLRITSNSQNSKNTSLEFR